jgi:hypothetical protein
MATFPSKFSALLLVVLCPLAVHAIQKGQARDDEFGPVVRAYLGYLRNEQEVVDDRVSRREISSSYYRRNSNRIKALRQMAVRMARESHNDYLPELEAVTVDEFGMLFGSEQPQPAKLKVGEVLRNTFRFLGIVRTGDVFYLFARLDPYEQSETTEKGKQSLASPENGPNSAGRSRKVVP